jgi:hypothetical protein
MELEWKNALFFVAIQCVVQKSSVHRATKFLKLHPHKIRDVQQPFPLTHKPLLLVA